MRDIKFRAWDISEKAMLSHEYMCTCDLQYDDFANNQESYPIMQYVEQKDKNKTEIYEGDICTYKNKHGIHIGVIKFINTLNAFRLVFVDNEEFYFISEINEIIGNIYENPE